MFINIGVLQCFYTASSGESCVWWCCVFHPFDVIQGHRNLYIEARM